ncbi:MAG TPA: hypothetical protein VMV71_03845 [Candidatus Paceibacterota bacterium]|nr:hypothetical protein [Candidatus Paceibacterota bacterium]
MKNQFPYKAIVASVNMVDMPPPEIFSAVLLALANFVRSIEIDNGHDEIAGAFKERMLVFETFGDRDISSAMEPLFKHLAAEKERCALEIAAHLQKRDGKKEGKRRSSFDASKIRQG